MKVDQSLYLSNLIANINTAKQTLPARKFEFAAEFPMSESAQLENQTDMGILSEIEHGIYIIRFAQPEKVEVSQVRRLLIEYKSNKERSCPKINKNTSPVIYVGSSTTGLVKRLSQHFGFGPSKTYALHLQHWFKGFVSIDVLDYTDTTRPVLQLVEDAISSELMPMFGKQGGNSK